MSLVLGSDDTIRRRDTLSAIFMHHPLIPIQFLHIWKQANHSNSALHLLPPILSTTADLPPVIGPRERLAAANGSQKSFMKKAMRDSGKIPGRGLLDGRRRV